MTIRRIFLTFMFSCMAWSLTAADEKFSLTMKLTDSLSKEPVAFATIYVSPDGTSKSAVYAVTDKTGKGVIADIPKAGDYVFVAELMGYKRLEKKVKLSKKNTDLGELFMYEDISMMDAAMITTVGNTIIVKKDTVEYNAEAFKISNNDMLEDLLKKLPGIEVGQDGKITANGETITKIMIDGKEFFLDDPKLASRNIPANIVNKVRVLEKKSDQAEFTGIDDGEEKTIIDLKIKPGMMDTWFGNLSGGGGMDMSQSDNQGRFQASGLVGRFTENTQISILGNGNNTNNRGFNDMSGGMMRVGGGDGKNGGVYTSWMGGADFSHNIGGDRKREIGASYLYDGSIRDALSNSVRTNFLNDSESLISRNDMKNHYFTDGHRGSVEFDYRFNDKTSFSFDPSFHYGHSTSDEKKLFSTENSNSGMVNDGGSDAYSKGITWNTDGRLLYRQKIGSRPGRTLSISGNYSLSNDEMDGENNSKTYLYRNGKRSDSTIIQQDYHQKDDRYSVNGKLTYTEPLGRNFFLQAAYRFSWSRSTSVKRAFDRPTGMLDSLYSNDMTNSYTNHEIQLSMMKQEEKYNIQVGFNAQPSTTATESRIGVIRDTSYTVWNFAPSVRFDYRFNKSNVLRVNYRGSTRQPSVNQLMPAPDNSNPLNIRLGNPALAPAFRNNIRIVYRYNDRKTFSTVMLHGGFNYVKDDIINARWYDGDGVQYRAPINSKRPTLSGNLMLMFNIPFGKSGVSISSSTTSDVSSNLSYTGSDTSARSLEEIRDHLIGGRTTSLRVSENLSFTYRNDFLDARLGARFSYQNAWYEISSQKQADTWTNQVYAQISGSLPWGMDIKTDAVYDYYIGYEKGYGDPTVTWNAEILQSFLKGNLTLSFKVYDILNQAKSKYRNVTDNYMEDVYRNTLGQYFMVSLIWKFGQKQKSSYGGGKYSKYRHYGRMMH